jgi:putative addiction module antidote
MTTVKLTTIGKSTGIVLPDEVLERLHVGSGDMLQLVETANGVELSPYDPEAHEQLVAATDVMSADREVLKKLAE